MVGTNSVKSHPHSGDGQHLLFTGAHDLTRHVLWTLRNLSCIWLIELLRRGGASEDGACMADAAEGW